VTTVARNAVYATPIAFWSDATRKSPAKARPHVNLSHAYYVAGDFDRAIAEARMALAIDRNNPVAQANLLAAWRRKTETTEVR
jgi:Flp pilus assembly protein TadD